MELHHTQIKEEKGFSAVEMLLSLIAVTLIAFVGYYVWNTQKTTDETLTAAGKTASVAAPKVATTKKTIEKFGTLYSAPSGNFTIQLKDGWTFTRYQKSDAIVANGNDFLKPVPGQAAVVNEIEGGKDGAGDGLIIQYAADSTNFGVKGYNLIKTFKTDAGLTVNEYSRVETQDQINAIGQLNKGGTYYRLTVDSPSKSLSTLVADYGVNTDQTNYISDVEAAVKTATIKLQ